jgi:hypothetical protein
MKQFLFALAVTLVFAPGALAGPAATASDKARAKATCNNVKASIGARAFKQLFAPKTHNARAAARNCRVGMTRFEHQNRESPEWKQACDYLQGPPADRPEGEQQANTYGKCVSELAKAKSRENREETISAAQQCKAERRDPDFAAEHENQSFAQVYGSQNTNAKNAFARCVHQKKAEMAEQETTTP